jgi:hypothetical protein
MAFTVEDYRDLVQLLREHPEWRAELRRELLGDELLRLPELMAENTAAIGRLEQGLESLRQAQERTEARVSDLAEVTARLVNEVGQYRGAVLETIFYNRPHLLELGLRRPRSVLVTDLLDLKDLVDAGSIDESEADALQNLDLLVAGRRGKGDEATEAYLAVEISGAIHANDVERARDRARILSRLGLDAKAIVAGSSIGAAASEAAKASDVAVVLRDIA